MQVGKKQFLWLDCDPGLDDTLAIILAAKTPSIQLIGVSTSAGNSSLNNTTKNALDILYNIGRSDVVVVKGSPDLIKGQAKLAQDVHGSGGLGGVEIDASPNKAITQNAFKYIRDSILACQQKVIWANTGALTNLCVLFRQYPEVKNNIQKIVIMGGAIGRGNVTPAAEFNIFFDPEAYKQVLQKKQQIPLVMIPLEVTHEVQAKDQIFDFLEKRSKTPIVKGILEMLKSFKILYKACENFDYPPVHDPTVINYILNPRSFEVKKALIKVDVGQQSYGRTNCFFNAPGTYDKDVDSIDLVALRMRNRSKFWQMFQIIFDEMFKQNKPQQLTAQ